MLEVRRSTSFTLSTRSSTLSSFTSSSSGSSWREKARSLRVMSRPRSEATWMAPSRSRNSAMSGCWPKLGSRRSVMSDASS